MVIELCQKPVWMLKQWKLVQYALFRTRTWMTRYFTWTHEEDDKTHPTTAADHIHSFRQMLLSDIDQFHEDNESSPTAPFLLSRLRDKSSRCCPGHQIPQISVQSSICVTWEKYNSVPQQPAVVTVSNETYILVNMWVRPENVAQINQTWSPVLECTHKLFLQGFCSTSNPL